MNKVISMILLLSLLLVGCHHTEKKESVSSNASSASYTFNIETDAQPDLGDLPDATYTKNGVYRLNQLDDGIYQITFTDKKTNKTVPLCTKPNCNHKSIGCEANLADDSTHEEVTYIGNGYIQYYKGALYVPVKYKDYVYLQKISADGSSRSLYMKLCRFLVVKSTSGIEEKSTPYYPTISIHRGYVYFTNDEIHGTSATLYRMKLGGDKLEVIKSMKKGHPQIMRIHSYGDNIFFIAGAMSEDGLNYDGHLYRYDISTGKTVLTGKSVIRNYTVINGYIYYEDKKDNGKIYRMKVDEDKSEFIASLSYDAENQEIFFHEYNGDLIVTFKDQSNWNVAKQYRIHDNKIVETVNNNKYSPYTEL